MKKCLIKCVHIKLISPLKLLHLLQSINLPTRNWFLLTSFWLRKCVCNLKVCGDICKQNNTIIGSFRNWVTINFNMFCLLLINWIGDSLDVIGVDFMESRIVLRKPSSDGSSWSQVICEHVAEIAWYSNSVDDLHLYGYFLFFQVIKESPKNTYTYLWLSVVINASQFISFISKVEEVNQMERTIPLNGS